jgi:hypothetical protein
MPLASTGTKFIPSAQTQVWHKAKAIRSTVDFNKLNMTSLLMADY